MLHNSSFFRKNSQNNWLLLLVLFCSVMFAQHNETQSVQALTIWNGTTWSNGAPTSADDARIEGNYTSTGNLTANTLTVANSAVVSILSNHNVILVGSLTVNPGCTFTLQNNANLVQNASTAVNTGAIIVRRNSSSIKRLDYTFWSSPVTGQGLYAFSPLTFDNRFYSFSTPLNNFVQFSGFNITGLNVDGVNGVDNNNAQFETAKGYLIRCPYNHSTTGAVWSSKFTGVPNNGPQTYFMTAGINLIGNPYPSPINVSNFIDANPSITGALYFWRKTNDDTSPSYSVVNKFAYVGNGAIGGDTGTPFFVAGNEANWTVNTAQGFFVEAPIDSDVIFTNAMRRAVNTNQFFKTAETAATVNVTDGIYWLNLANNQGYYSQLAVGHTSQATVGIDRGIDALNYNRQFYAASFINGAAYTIQGRPTFNINDVVPLVYKAETVGSYTFSKVRGTGIFDGATQMIILRDKLLGLTQNLNAGSYTFQSNVGTFNNRFEIIYDPTLLAANDFSLEANAIKVFTQNNEIVVSAETVLENVQVYDIKGSLLTAKNSINAMEARLGVTASQQILLVKITTAEGATVTKKISL